MKQQSTNKLLIQFLQGMTAISSIFALLICALIIVNFIQLKRTNPLNTPVLIILNQQLSKDPGNAELQQNIRQIDLLARKAFFTSQWQIRTGAYLLFAWLLVAVICMKSLEMITPKIPVMQTDSPEDPITRRKIQRRWIGIGGAIIVLFSLTLAVFTHLMLTGTSSEVASLKSAESQNPIIPNTEQPNTPSAIALDTTKQAGDSVTFGATLSEGFPSQKEIKSNFLTFRGLDGNGIASQKNIPTEWDGASGKNIRWKTEIPLPGYNSPIIWNNRVYLSGAKESRKEVYCIDAASGKILWTADLSKIPGTPGPATKILAETGQAAPTLTTDGRRVYTIFANGDIAAVDMEGKIVWSKNLGLPKNHYGHSSSLIMYHDLLIVQYDQTGSGKVMALSGKTGEMVWETSRNVKVSWASPVLVNTGNRMELLLAAEPEVASYDPATGKELWKLDCISGEVGPSVAYANRMVFSINEYSKLAAIKLGETPSLLWESDEYLSDVPSPVAINDMLFVVTSYGAVVCYNAATGEKHWMKELDKSVYASPMIADGKLFILDKLGTMHILQADKTLAVVGTASIGEGSSCTPAFGEGRIYIRGNKNLFCVEK